MEVKQLRVIDTSCTAECKVREHCVILDGRNHPVKFEFGKETILPFAVGVKFMLPGFIVQEITGEELIQPNLMNDVQRLAIGENEIIAQYDELTVSALQMRAIRLNGGEKFLAIEGNAADKEDMIGFLKVMANGGPKDDDEAVEFADEQLPMSEGLTGIVKPEGVDVVISLTVNETVEDKIDLGAPPPVNNEHVAAGAVEFTAEEIAANAPKIKEKPPQEG